jgi:hypothetical protein
MWPFTESEWRRDMTNVLTEDEIPEGAITGALFRLGSVFYRDNPEDRQPAHGPTGGTSQ